MSCAQWLSLSEGVVCIKSKDCTVQPQVDEQMLSHPSDLDRMMHGVRKLARLMQAEPFQRIAKEIVSFAGSPQDVEHMSDADLASYVHLNSVPDQCRSPFLSTLFVCLSSACVRRNFPSLGSFNVLLLFGWKTDKRK